MITTVTGYKVLKQSTVDSHQHIFLDHCDHTHDLDNSVVSLPHTSNSVWRSTCRDSDWRRKLATGEVCNNPYEKIVRTNNSRTFSYTYEATPISWSCNPKYTLQTHTFGIFPDDVIGTSVTSPPSDWDSYVRSKEDQAALRAYSQSYASANLGASLGELPETLRTVRDVFKGVVGVCIEIKRRRWTKLKKLVTKTDIADLRMLYRYGLRPLAYDLQNYTDVITRLQEAVPKRFTPKAKESIMKAYDNGPVWLLAKPIWFGQYDIEVLYRAELFGTARAGVLYDVVEGGLEHLLGVYDIPQAIWELTTLSFVLDWFSNVGLCISALSPKTNLRELTAWKGSRVFTTETATITQVKPISWWPTLNEEVNCSGVTLVKQTLRKRRQPTYLSQNLRLTRPDVQLSLDQIGDLATIVKGFARNLAR